MADYLSYWKPSTVASIPAEALLDHAASNQYSRVVEGDTVWIVTAWPGGHLVLLGRLLVGRVCDYQTAQRLLQRQDLWDASHHIIAVEDQAEPVREVEIHELARELRFDSSSDRLTIVGGAVDAKQLQTMRRLTSASVALLRSAWEAAPGAGEPTDASAVEARGAGFGSAASNREVEEAAIIAVTRNLETDGWHVTSKESERVGYDLLCRKAKATRHVEVKGVRGTNPSFIITDAELRRARADRRFWLYVVTAAATSSPTVTGMDRDELLSRHEFIPLAHRAVPVAGRASRVE